MGDVSLYTSLPNLIIGFHGCDMETYDKVIKSGEMLKPSNNKYDWLGNGIYFWEQNLGRAWEWAKKSSEKSKGKIKTPAVIGAVIDLGFCLNLLDDECINLLEKQYKILQLSATLYGNTLPQNKNTGDNKDLLLRNLDCAVIENLHRQRNEDNERPFDSVRGVFFEGNPIFPTSGFMQHSHIQICVRNPNCIKGFFSPRKADIKWINP